MTEFEEVPEFSNDLKKLYRKHKSIYSDLQTFEKALVVKLPGYLPGTKHISNLGKNIEIPIYKVTHFRCASLKGKGVRSGIRIIYTYIQNKQKIVLIEIYHKNKQENHNRDRIIKYCENQS
ncbi:MAG: hypothetical protein CHKLHMKO_00415 [Candidatus Argoarchaeum ethanivorans]|uniref:Addiction module toxin RelE n=1 Tax=Candidatus Argoarchaeum ethanivorans TaxID=2608793 RepID=A0A811TEB2_9EURY|nr:MAG: hypothetical protein CHKLHMKO_00415 [Candidatus Argoarchaeum ethanivorans]